jgi:hypothetical protein
MIRVVVAISQETMITLKGHGLSFGEIWEVFLGRETLEGRAEP